MKRLAVVPDLVQCQIPNDQQRKCKTERKSNDLGDQEPSSLFPYRLICTFLRLQRFILILRYAGAVYSFPDDKQRSEFTRNQRQPGRFKEIQLKIREFAAVFRLELGISYRHGGRTNTSIIANTEVVGSINFLSQRSILRMVWLPRSSPMTHSIRLPSGVRSPVPAHDRRHRGRWYSRLSAARS